MKVNVFDFERKVNQNYLDILNSYIHIFIAKNIL